MPARSDLEADIGVRDYIDTVQALRRCAARKLIDLARRRDPASTSGISPRRPGNWTRLAEAQCAQYR